MTTQNSSERVAKWRAQLNEEEKESKKKKDAERKRIARQNRSSSQKAKYKEKAREREANRRASMTDEQYSKEREKDRKRWSEKYPPEEGPKAYAHLIRTDEEWGEWLQRKRESNRKSMKKKRENQSNEEREFERVEDLLRKRKARAERSKVEIEIDKKKARNGMQYVPILPFKTRRRKGAREEYMWWQLWKESQESKDLIRAKLPDFAERFSEWEQKAQNPYKDEEEEEERQKSMSTTEKNEERNRKLKDYRQRLQKETLEKLREPIELPEIDQEKSEYELIREKNIAELEQAKKDSGLFN